MRIKRWHPAKERNWMEPIKLNFETTVNHHQCVVHTDGDWIIFKCKLCPSYDRRINVITGERRVTGLSELISHSGRYELTWN